MSLRTALHRPHRRSQGRAHRPGSSLAWILDRPATSSAAHEERQLLTRR